MPPSFALGSRGTQVVSGTREDKLLDTIAGWIAPIATMIAAMMTAANFGARLTGWGFVVFVAGSISWSIVGLETGQANLLATNGFLTLVNLIGVWRWLGKQRAYEDGGKAAAEASRRAEVPTLFTATGIAGMPVVDEADEPLGKAVEALVECSSGCISYIVVASGGLGGIDEQLRAIPRAEIRFSCEQLSLSLPKHVFETFPPLAAGDWPAEADGAQVTSR